MSKQLGTWTADALRQAKYILQGYEDESLSDLESWLNGELEELVDLVRSAEDDVCDREVELQEEITGLEARIEELHEQVTELEEQASTRTENPSLARSGGGLRYL